ncbi:MAG: sialate O-acetylesterase [Clostridia bacterium]|nr:sialate O-acetylesterase [Clostridia bacterium]
MIHSFLLIGQSNMAGRGFRDEVEPIVNDKIVLLRNGLWRTMYTPFNPDRSTAGVNLSESFADRYAKEKGVEVGIIPCADGGTCIDQWAVGGQLFDHALYMCELATRTSTIAGVLWHQGESDCTDELYPYYEEKLSVIMEAFREKLGLYDVPFLLGGLGDYLLENTGWYGANYGKINQALENYASKTPMTGFVSAKGLTSNPDKLHFNAASLREFGERYYEEFLKLEDKNKVFKEKPMQGNSIVTGIENL